MSLSAHFKLQILVTCSFSGFLIFLKEKLSNDRTDFVIDIGVSHFKFFDGNNSLLIFIITILSCDLSKWTQDSFFFP